MFPLPFQSDELSITSSSGSAGTRRDLQPRIHHLAFEDVYSHALTTTRSCASTPWMVSHAWA